MKNAAFGRDNTHGGTLCIPAFFRNILSQAEHYWALKTYDKWVTNGHSETSYRNPRVVDSIQWCFPCKAGEPVHPLKEQKHLVKTWGGFICSSNLKKLAWFPKHLACLPTSVRSRGRRKHKLYSAREWQCLVDSCALQHSQWQEEYITKLCITSVNNSDLFNLWDLTKNHSKTIKSIQHHTEIINR